MDSKTLNVLEYPKILGQLAGFCDFSASKDLANSLEPTPSFELANARIAETSEARKLLSMESAGIGAAHDIRPQADLAARGGVLDPHTLLDVKSTLISCRDLKKSFEKRAEEYPRLTQIVSGLPDTHGLVDAITRILSDRGEILDSASPKLGDIRRNLRVAQDRLMTRLQKYVTDSKTVSMLQEPIITQRDGRYVIPLRAEFKGKIKSIVHDQSSSGATLFVEPLPVVEANNEIRELQLAQRDEERKILAQVSLQIGEHATELKYGVENLAALDLAFAKAKYADELKASEPILYKDEVKQSSIANRQSSIKLLNARHPLLDPNTVVPVDVDPAPGPSAPRPAPPRRASPCRALPRPGHTRRNGSNVPACQHRVSSPCLAPPCPAKPRPAAPGPARPCPTTPRATYRSGTCTPSQASTCPTVRK